MTLGEELRRRREERGIELSEIADATCIGVRFLRAIEEDDFATLPGGLFTRSFIRSFARYVGLDENAALRLYFQQTGEGKTEKYDLTGEAVREKTRSSMWANVTIAVAVLLVLAFGGFAGWHYWKRVQSPNQPSTANPAPTTSMGSPRQTSNPIPAPASQPPESTALNAEPSLEKNATESEFPEDSTALVTKPPVDSAPMVKSAEPVKSPEPKKIAELPQVKKPLTTPPQAPQLREESMAPAPPLNLSIRAKGDCWVRVQTDAAMPRGEALRSGDRRVFTATDKLVISARNASQLTITINGHPVQLPPESVVGEVVITPQNLSRYIKQ